MIKIYSIQLNTPLGIKEGKLKMSLHNNKIEGVLESMGSKNEFHNGRLINNNFEFSGEFKYLISKIPYSATGNLSNNSLSGSVKTKFGIFPVKGKLISES